MNTDVNTLCRWLRAGDIQRAGEAFAHSNIRLQKYVAPLFSAAGGNVKSLEVVLQAYANIPLNAAKRQQGAHAVFDQNNDDAFLLLWQRKIGFSGLVSFAPPHWEQWLSKAIETQRISLADGLLGVHTTKSDWEPLLPLFRRPTTQSYMQSKCDDVDWLLRFATWAILFNNKDMYHRLVQHNTAARASWLTMYSISRNAFELAQIVFDRLTPTQSLEHANFLLRSNVSAEATVYLNEMVAAHQRNVLHQAVEHNMETAAQNLPRKM